MSAAARELESFLQPALARCRSQFPRSCTKCKRPFSSFADFVGGTRRIGAPRLDIVEDDEPLGMLVFVNCACGTTLALCYEDTADHDRFNAAVRAAAPAGAAQGTLLTGFVDAVNALAQRGVAASAASPPPEPLLLEAGASMVALIERGQIAIPPFPAVAFKVAELAGSPTVSLQALARELSADHALAAAVLLRANAALHARGAPVTTLQAAVTRLGTQDVARHVMAASLGASTASSGPLWSLRCHVWHQSLVRATLARFLALRRGLSGDEAFLCGLLHSLGSMIGALSLEKVLRARAGFPRQTLPWWSRVLEHFRVELARLAAREWRLLPLFAEAIAHDGGAATAASTNRRMLEVVAVAGAVTRLLGERRRIEPGDLIAAGAAAEAEAFAKAIPDAAPMIAALETRGPSKPTDSFVAIDHRAALQPPSAPITLAPAGAPQWRYQVVALDERVLVVEGQVPLPEMQLTCLRPADEQASELWAVPRAAESRDGRCRFVLVPFALSQVAEQRWQRWLGA